MKLNQRAIIMIIIGTLVLIFGIKAFSNSGKMSADVVNQADQIDKLSN